MQCVWCSSGSEGLTFCIEVNVVRMSLALMVRDVHPSIDKRFYIEQLLTIETNFGAKMAEFDWTIEK